MSWLGSPSEVPFAMDLLFRNNLLDTSQPHVQFPKEVISANGRRGDRPRTRSATWELSLRSSLGHPDGPLSGAGVDRTARSQKRSKLRWGTPHPLAGLQGGDLDHVRPR